MSEMACFRSLWETLVAAASSFAIFVAANWGMAYVLGTFQPEEFSCVFSKVNLPGILIQILVHITLAFASPMWAFSTSVMNAMEVRAVKRMLARAPTAGLVQEKMHHDSIAITTVCPIFIRFPASALTSDELRNLGRRGYKSVTDINKLEDKCPLELRPSAAATELVASTTHANAEDSTQLICLQIPSVPVLFDQERSSGRKEKALLLMLGFVPTYKHLKFVRSRNRLLSAVAGFQAGGYKLTVIQRAAQHLAICPVEAIVTFHCIITGLQVLIELYACSPLTSQRLSSPNASA